MMLNDDEWEEARGRIGGFLAGLLVGALVGAGAALLFAPESGLETRRRIGRLAQDTRTNVEDQVEEWSGEARRRLARRRKKMKRAMRRAGEAMDDVRDRLTP